AYPRPGWDVRSGQHRMSPVGRSVDQHRTSPVGHRPHPATKRVRWDTTGAMSVGVWVCPWWDVGSGQYGGGVGQVVVVAVVGADDGVGADGDAEVSVVAA